MGHGIAQGHGVVYAGVGIKNDFVRHGWECIGMREKFRGTNHDMPQ
jgi:hypothetical protein